MYGSNSKVKKNLQSTDQTTRCCSCSCVNEEEDYCPPNKMNEMKLSPQASIQVNNSDTSEMQPQNYRMQTDFWPESLRNQFMQIDSLKNLSQESMIPLGPSQETSRSRNNSVFTQRCCETEMFDEETSCGGSCQPQRTEQNIDEEEFYDQNNLQKNPHSFSCMKNSYEHAEQQVMRAKLTVAALENLNVDKDELVRKYFNTYQRPDVPIPYTAHFPSRSLSDNNATKKRSISVSTESEPALRYHPKTHQSNGHHLFKYDENFLVMHANLNNTVPCLQKSIPGQLDNRLEEVARAFKENGTMTTAGHKEECDLHEVRKPAQSEQITDLTFGPPAIQLDPLLRDTDSVQLNSRRAFFDPSGIIDVAHQEPPNPKPQFQLISLSTVIHDSGYVFRFQPPSSPVPATRLNIPRSPIQCPDSTCQKSTFVSDFNKHMVVDHTKAPRERISPQQCKNFFLDPKLSHYNQRRCHFVYLITNKIQDLGSGKYKDFLPLLVMMSRVRLSDISGFGQSSRNENDENQHFIMIWLTGLVPPSLPVFVNLAVWPRSSPIPMSHIVHSGQLYSIRDPQDTHSVWSSGQMLLLSPQQIQILTNGGRQMLELQLIVN